MRTHRSRASEAGYLWFYKRWVAFRAVERIERKHVGNLSVSSHVEVTGQVDGDVSVATGGRLFLRGQVTGNVTVKAGGYADVRGQVLGNLTNDGGEVRISGMVIGKLRRRGGSTVVEDGAAVLGGLG
jgi:cytoskeletal protein CcmA (bactofilin family)